MSWQYSGAPNHIAPETGPNLLDGEGPWTVPLTPGTEYALSVDVLGEGEAVVEWAVTITDSDGVELAYPAEAETVPGGEWVTVTRPLTAPAFEATALVTLTAEATTRAPALAELTGRMILTVPGDVLAETIMASGGIVAGTPGGARVELTDEGLVAYDTNGTETAQIQGEGGSFVGGEFRTSDTLPGQVTLSDEAYVDPDDFSPGPGIRVTPPDMSQLLSPPGLGPTSDGFIITGGQNLAGNYGYASFSPGAAQVVFQKAGGVSDISAYDGAAVVRTSTADGRGSTLRATGGSASLSNTTSIGVASEIVVESGSAYLANTESSSAVTSQVRSDFREASLSSTGSDGAERSLSVDSDGVWVKTNESGSWKHYNLELTARDSGWIPLTHATGYKNASGGAPFEYRLMGGMVHLRGRTSPTSGIFTAGTAHTIGTLPTEIRPPHTYRTLIAGGGSSQWGRVDISAGTGALTVAPISGDMDWVDLVGTMWTID